ncbi:MAG: glycosyltransferase family 9 protein [Candidatus Melainabacteria bacterium]|nr:glycosyltransferase family 9 protein [Candidatus Melainabacteria bacterium]
MKLETIFALPFYFAPISDGLGDLLVSLPGLLTLVRTGEPTFLIIRSPKQEQVAELIPGLSGAIREPDFHAKVKRSDDIFVNMRDHPLQTEAIFGSDAYFEKNGPLNIVDLCRQICFDLIERDLKIPLQFEYEPFPYKKNSASFHKVIFIPGSAGRFKCWPLDSWLNLYKALSSRGLECIVIGQPDKSPEVLELLEYTKDLGLAHVKTPTLKDAIDVISSASAVISVDTGLMHLSVQQQKPTIAMHLKRSIFIRPENNCISIIAEDCIPECLTWTQNDGPSKSINFETYAEIEFNPCYGQQNCKRIAEIEFERVLSEYEKLMTKPMNT